ncbi:MAG: hypothetical protein ACOYNY_27525 [Caldilineaceae bacterium]
MEQRDQVKQIVSKLWRVQYKVVGDTSIDKLYDAVQNKLPLDELLITAKGGSSFDLHSAWQLLYEAIDLTVGVLTLYGMWKQRNKQAPTKEEILQLLREAKTANSYSQAVLDKLGAVIEQVSEK